VVMYVTEKKLNTKTRLSLILSAFIIVLCLPTHVHAQTWSGILKPTSGTGACTPTNISSPGDCAIDWSTAGVPGGIPSGSWTQSGSTITAAQSPCNNGAADCTSTIQTALNSCGTDHYVLLGAGTFLLNGTLSVPSNCVLRGAGANQTILNEKETSGAAVQMGVGFSGGPTTGGTVTITSGNTAGSASIVVSSASGISVGMYLLITELNDSTYVSIAGADGSCTWCDGGIGWNGTRVRGQIVEVESVSGTTVGISPDLYTNYGVASGTSPAFATPFSAAAKFAGVENIQFFANNTGVPEHVMMGMCAYCWASGIEGNYADGDHIDITWSFHDEVINSYFSNAFLHTPGAFDSTVDVSNKSTGCLIQNNIFERLHNSIMLEWGAAGNVVGYNYTIGDFDSSSYLWMYKGIDFHGASPQFNLMEGNNDISSQIDSDWGSASNNTLFRNFLRGTTLDCNPASGRGPVTCSPIGEPAAGPPNTGGINGWWLTEGTQAEVDSFEAADTNTIGNALGSKDAANLIAYDDPINGGPEAIVRMAVAVCGPSPCGANSRDNFKTTYSYAIGYGEDADSGSSGFESVMPFNTLFVHGDYSAAANAVTWATGVTHTIPASFYLSSKPAWFGNVTWPPIGPDVTGGTANSYGHAYEIPAEVCYKKVMGGTNGAGSPLSFNANACYGGPSSTSLPAAPTKPIAVAQ